MPDFRELHPMLLFIVEDDPFYAELLQYHLSLNSDDEIRLFSSGRACLQHLYQNPAVICLDYTLPDMAGEEVLQKIKATHPDLPIIIISAQEDIKTAVELLKLGASDYIVKDEDTKEVLWKTLNLLRKQVGLQKQIESLQQEVGQKFSLEALFIGQSPAITKVYSLIKKGSQSRINVNITGETGTGKETTAKAIHYNSERKAAPFISLNMAAVPPQKLETELFGYTKGAFNSAAN